MSTILFPSPVFGPVHSRRLGRSLGVNLLPGDGKVCSFDCVYCECGLNDEHRPQVKLPTREMVASELEAKLKALLEEGREIDAITYAGNGEPTSHPEFLAIVRDTAALRTKYFPQAKICLLTNTTHLDRADVREAVGLIDRPCLKLDAVDRDYIERVNRPNARYVLEEVVGWMKSFKGRCIIQTMFMKGEFEGQSVDNTTDAYVLPWVKTVAEIAPEGVDIYTLARDTPRSGLVAVSLEELERIAGLLREAGVKDVHCYP